jgi:hypothetical protein
MKKIFKYPIEKPDENGEAMIEVPVNSTILTVEQQYQSQIVVYAIVDVDNQQGIRRVQVRVVGTGHEINFDTNDFKYLGTVKFGDGQLMFHVFIKE